MSGEILAPYDESAWVQFGKLVREYRNSHRVEARIAPVGIELDARDGSSMLRWS